VVTAGQGSTVEATLILIGIRSAAPAHSWLRRRIQLRVVSRTRSVGSATQGVAAAAVLIATSLVLSRLLGVVRLTVFSALYGTSGAMAAYNAAFRIPDTIFVVVAGGALSSAFIPVFAGLIESRRERDAWAAASTVLNTLSILMAGVSILAFVFTPQLTDLIVLHGTLFTAATRTETITLTRIMLAQPFLLGIGGLFAAMQNSYRRFLLPTIAPVVYNVCIILGTIVFAPRYGIYATAWSVVVGAVLMFELQIWGVQKEAIFYRIAVQWRMPEAREILRLIGPRLIGLSAFQFMLIVTTALAAGLPSSGFNAIFYAWSLMLFPVSVIGSSMGTALFPTISRHSATARTQEMQDTVVRSLRAVLFLAVPAASAMILVSHALVVTLYAHGPKWTEASTNATTSALICYALAIPPLALIEVLARSFYAMRNTRTPVGYAVLASTIDIMLMFGFIHLVPVSEGQAGLALATAFATWIQCILLARALGKKMPAIFGPEVRIHMARVAAAALLMCAAIVVVRFLLDTRLSEHSWQSSSIVLVVSVLVGATMYAAISYRLRIDELARLAGLARRIRSAI
jgi:putative peptidoglycan lipid II flippase